MVHWMNMIAFERYETQTSRFKEMVRIDNPYLALLTNLVLLPPKLLKAQSRHLQRVCDTLIANPRNNDICSSCYIFYRKGVIPKDHNP